MLRIERKLFFDYEGYRKKYGDTATERLKLERNRAARDLMSARNNINQQYKLNLSAGDKVRVQTDPNFNKVAVGKTASNIIRRQSYNDAQLQAENRVKKVMQSNDAKKIVNTAGKVTGGILLGTGALAGGIALYKHHKKKKEEENK